jgi:TrmH family RNA methyltransferase
MIPLYKLERLPRTQKLRKIAKILMMAEKRLFMAVEKTSNIFTAAELVFFTDAAKLLAADKCFPADAHKIFNEAADIFQAAIAADSSILFDDASLFRRALNNVKHILLMETGRDQADWDFTGSDGQLDAQKRKVFKGMYVYMEDIRSPFNVGAMFRTAESFGVEKIILSPFCADPRHRRAERTAMGCIGIIPWERRDLTITETGSQVSTETANDLSGESLPVFALETGGIPIAEFPFPRRGLLIAGSEELGVSPRALAAADASLGRVSIPCYGTKASLNVSVAFGIAMQAWAQAVTKDD